MTKLIELAHPHQDDETTTPISTPATLTTRRAARSSAATTAATTAGVRQRIGCIGTVTAYGA